jgi:hypothetical protein
MSRPVDPHAMFTSLVHADPATLTMSEVVATLQMFRVVQGWMDHFQARLLSPSNQLDVSAAEVLIRNAGISAAEAKAKDRRSKALEEAPSFSDALAAGAVSAGHTDALANATSRLDQPTKDLFLGHEAALLDQATHSTPEEFARHCRQLKDRIAKDQGIERSERQKRDTTLRSSICPRTGMYRINAELDPELGHQVFSSLEAEIAAMIAGNTELVGVDRNHLAAHALSHLISGGHQAVRPTQVEMTIIVDLDTLQDGLREHSICEFGDGTPIPVGMARRLACNASILPVVLNGDGIPLDIGRTQRLANRAQRRALRAIYRTCAFHGCDISFSRCEIHHLHDWAKGGKTDLRHLIPICKHHHHLIHEGGWTLTLADDRTLTVRTPCGELHATCPIQIRPGDRVHQHRQRRHAKQEEQEQQQQQEQRRDKQTDQTTPTLQL